ncbi:MAG TPA: Fe2+-dependent dioxygenase [Xenococcaceae cyanobacterium]
MIFSIPHVLTLQEVAKITAHLKVGEFADIKETKGCCTQTFKERAYWNLVKNNQQLPTAATLEAKLTEQIKSALYRNSLFQTAVRPKSIHSCLLQLIPSDRSSKSPLNPPPLPTPPQNWGGNDLSPPRLGEARGGKNFENISPPNWAKTAISCHDEGMSDHYPIDRVSINHNKIWRTDMAFTLFLNSPLEYQGGELVIKDTDKEKTYKLEAGCVIIYPATTLHRINPITRGTRLAAIGRVESLIQDPGDREILFDLETARRVIFFQSGKNAEYELISKSITNLISKWADV